MKCSPCQQAAPLNRGVLCGGTRVVDAVSSSCQGDLIIHFTSSLVVDRFCVSVGVEIRCSFPNERTNEAYTGLLLSLSLESGYMAVPCLKSGM